MLSWSHTAERMRAPCNHAGCAAPTCRASASTNDMCVMINWACSCAHTLVPLPQAVQGSPVGLQGAQDGEAERALGALDEPTGGGRGREACKGVQGRPGRAGQGGQAGEGRLGRSEAGADALDTAPGTPAGERASPRHKNPAAVWKWQSAGKCPRPSLPWDGCESWACKVGAAAAWLAAPAYPPGLSRPPPGIPPPSPARRLVEVVGHKVF